MAEFIYGHWAVMESLRSGRRNIEQLLLTETLEEKGMVVEIVALAREKGVKMQRVHRRIMDDLANGLRRIRGLHLWTQFGLDRVPVEAAERGVEECVVNGLPDLVEAGERLRAPGLSSCRGGAERRSDDQREQRASGSHLMSALIAGGGSNAVGATSLYSYDEIRMT